ncbi:TIR domain-containing protein [Deinococcus hohokamensis]|uniref:TIR domain-containing protein n=1 Tax=Deinococcus hohokamensis TaxID=309883 RepID=A0ABV9I3L6_9DEIO
MLIRASEVFRTVGLPHYTYVKPSRYGEIYLDVESPGKHLLIEGPSGIGKTCVVYKVFEDLEISDVDFTYISCRDQDAADKVNEAIELSLAEVAGGHYYFIDDFHILDASARHDLGEKLKRISDSTFKSTDSVKFILVGIPTAGESLLYNAKDLGPRIGMYKFHTADNDEIGTVIEYGESALNIEFSDKESIIAESAGNFWLAQHLCLKICAQNSILAKQTHKKTANVNIIKARNNLLTELHSKYRDVVIAFARGKKWRPGGNKPYLDILLSIANRGESVQTFDAIKSAVDPSKRPGINAVRKRIPEVIYDKSKGTDLRKQLFFDADGGSFSIEDPLFLYYLKHLDQDQLYKELGISAENLKTFDYDIGFSFSGEDRKVVEEINKLLKEEDIVTFYDFDHQAALLGKNLEVYFESIYSSGCRYYLIFLGDTYREKVWPTLERNFITKADRKDHIIPVVLSKSSKTIMLGLPSSIGHIDLSELHKYSENERGYLKENVVDLITEKISSSTAP